jgi:glutathione peroxidase
MKLILLFTAFFLALQAVGASGEESLYSVKLKDIDGRDTSLASYKGRVLLIVNVASKCGYTKQYAGLEALHQKHKAQGFAVLGFPCNQFGGQEPGTNEEIKEFCSSKFSVTFPLFDKLEVNGAGRHPLYTRLAGPASPLAGDIKWNFTKFLVGKDGRLLKRFESKVAPEAEELTQAVEAALAAK